MCRSHFSCSMACSRASITSLLQAPSWGYLITESPVLERTFRIIQSDHKQHRNNPVLHCPLPGFVSLHSTHVLYQPKVQLSLCNRSFPRLLSTTGILDRVMLLASAGVGCSLPHIQFLGVCRQPGQGLLSRTAALPYQGFLENISCFSLPVFSFSTKGNLFCQQHGFLFFTLLFLIS